MGNEQVIARLTDSIAGAMPTLNRTDERVAIALYRLLAGGRPVEHANIGSRAGVPLARVDEIIGAWPGVFHDEEGRVVGFWGLALRDMPHRFEIDGTQIRTWCAWDPLFIGPLLGKPARVESRDPVSGETLTLTVTPEGVRDLSHEDAKVSFLMPDAPWDHSVIQGFCHYVLFFTSRETGEQWTAKHDGTFLLSVAEAYEVGRRTNERQFSKAPGEVRRVAASTLP